MEAAGGLTEEGKPSPADLQSSLGSSQTPSQTDTKQRLQRAQGLQRAGDLGMVQSTHVQMFTQPPLTPIQGGSDTSGIHGHLHSHTPTYIGH